MGQSKAGYLALATKGTKDYGGLLAPRFPLVYVATNHFSTWLSQQLQPRQLLHAPPHSHGAPFFKLRHTANAAKPTTIATTAIDAKFMLPPNYLTILTT